MVEDKLDFNGRLNRMKLPGSFTKQEGNKVIVKKQEYILIFAKLMDVKTLRTQRQTDTPPMYIYGDGYFLKGAEVYFKEANYSQFAELMSKRLNMELMQQLQAIIDRTGISIDGTSLALEDGNTQDAEIID